MALDFLSKILAAEWEDGGSKLGVEEVLHQNLSPKSSQVSTLHTNTKFPPFGAWYG